MSLPLEQRQTEQAAVERDGALHVAHVEEDGLEALDDQRRPHDDEPVGARLGAPDLARPARAAGARPRRRRQPEAREPLRRRVEADDRGARRSRSARRRRGRRRRRRRAAPRPAAATRASARGRVVARDLARVPLADPEAPRESDQIRRAPWPRVGGRRRVACPVRDVDPREVAAGERRVVDLAAAASS